MDEPTTGLQRLLMRGSERLVDASNTVCQQYGLIEYHHHLAGRVEYRPWPGMAVLAAGL